MKTLTPADMIHRIIERGWSQGSIVQYLQDHGHKKTNQGQVGRISRGGGCNYMLGATIRKLYLDVISGDEVA